MVEGELGLCCLLLHTFSLECVPLCESVQVLSGWRGLRQGEAGRGKLGAGWGDTLSRVPLADICFIALRSFSEG